MISICMTDLYVVSSIALLGFYMGVPVSFLVAFSYRSYITSRYLDGMMSAITSSPDLSSAMKVYASLGFLKKILVPGLLYGAVSEPRFLSIGFVSASDVKNFPPHFRKMLSKDSILQRISIGWFLVAGVIAYFDQKT